MAQEEDIAEIKANVNALGPTVDALGTKVEAHGVKVDGLATQIKKLKKDKWGIPIVVALITGVLALIGSFTSTWYSTRKQLDSEVRKAIGQETVTSYQNIRETIVELDSQVQAFCRFAQFGQGDELTDLCAKLQSYAENAPATLPDKTRGNLKDYVDYVARQYTDLNASAKDQPAVRLFSSEAKAKKLALLKEMDAVVQ